MKLEIGGIASWRLMFAVEGAVTVLAGIAALFLFVDRPAEARWLSADEKRAIDAAIAGDRVAAGRTSASLAEALRDPFLWLCGRRVVRPHHRRECDHLLAADRDQVARCRRPVRRSAC